MSIPSNGKSDDPHDWESADELLHHARSGNELDRRKIANNTWLERRYNGVDIAVRLHNTDVVTYHKNGTLTLNSGGWTTVTTKDRLNRFAGPFGISSKRGVWKISVRNPDYNLYLQKREHYRVDYLSYTLPMILADLRGEKVELWRVRNVGDFGTWQEAEDAHEAAVGEYCADYWLNVGDFYDGITLDPNDPMRYYDSPETAENEKHDEALIKQVHRYMNGLTKTKWAEIVDKASKDGTSGDCLFCQMAGQLHTTDGTTVASFGDDSDHLLSHLEERYYMVSLAWNAIAESGYRPEVYITDLKMVKRQLRKYFLARLLKGNRQGRIGYKHEYATRGWR